MTPAALNPPAFIMHVSATEARALNIPRLLDAIGEVESWNDDESIGALGERGRYQIRPALWNEYTSMPIALARFRVNSATVATRILKHWETILQARGCPQSIMPTVMVTWWQCGPHGTPSEKKRDSIQRVMNLYEEAKY